MLVIGIGIGFGATRVISAATEPQQESSQNATKAEPKSEEAMAHKEIEVDASKPIPTVKIAAMKDSKDGYNLHVDANNFRFTPEEAGKENKPNTGHAHVYVNDKKVGRVYGNWLYLSGSHFKKGLNTIEVTLNGNDHSDWLHKGEHISDSSIVNN